MLARILGPQDYGVFAGALAFVSVFAPFSSWGSGNVLIKQVSVEPSRFPIYWGSALATTLYTGTLLGALVVILGGFLWEWSRVLLLFLLALGDLLGIRIADVASQAFQAFQRMSGTSLIWAGMTFFRLLALLAFVLLPVPKTAELWAWFYAASGLALGTLSALWVSFSLGFGSLRLAPMKGKWGEGFFFAVGLASQNTYNDLDKFLLARISSEQAAGVYTAAYRFVDAAFVPVRSLLYTTYPRFFQKGQQGLRATLGYAVRLLAIAMALAMGMAMVLLFLLPFIPSFLGREYAEVAVVLLWLMPVLFLRPAHYFVADALTGAGYQAARALFQIATALFNTVLNIAFIPGLGWRGAAVATWLSELFLVLSLWGFAYWRLRAQGRMA